VTGLVYRTCWSRSTAYLGHAGVRCCRMRPTGRAISAGWRDWVGLAYVPKLMQDCTTVHTMSLVERVPCRRIAAVYGVL